MTAAQHTPGPWEIDAHKLELAIEPDIALIESVRPKDWANARLIAAAPELLAAAQNALQWADHMGGFEAPVWKQIAAAIAKATGK